MTTPTRWRTLKVYAGSLDGKDELVVATTSEIAAMRRLRISAREFRQRFRVTLAEQYEAAKEHPEEVLHRPLWGVEGDPFEPLEPEGGDEATKR
jgi:hypothetical protein